MHHVSALASVKGMMRMLGGFELLGGNWTPGPLGPPRAQQHAGRCALAAAAPNHNTILLPPPDSPCIPKTHVCRRIWAIKQEKGGV